MDRLRAHNGSSSTGQGNTSIPLDSPRFQPNIASLPVNDTSSAYDENSAPCATPPLHNDSGYNTPLVSRHNRASSNPQTSMLPCASDNISVHETSEQCFPSLTKNVSHAQRPRDLVSSNENSYNPVQSLSWTSAYDSVRQFFFTRLIVLILNLFIFTPCKELFAHVRNHYAGATHLAARQPEVAAACILPRCSCQSERHAPSDDVNTPAAPRVSVPPLASTPGNSACTLRPRALYDDSPSVASTAPARASAALRNFGTPDTGAHNSVEPAANKLPPLPEFDETMPELWFSLVEQILNFHRLSDEARYICLISHFNKHSDYIYNLLRDPPSHDKYETAKKCILSHTSRYGNECIIRRLEEMQMGDDKPTTLWVRMRTMASERYVPHETLFQMWLDKLPYQVQLAATGQMHRPPDERASHADRAFFTLQRIEARKLERDRLSAPRSQRLKDGTQQGSTNRQQTTPSRAQSRNDSSPPSSIRSASPPPPVATANHKFCYYHRTFGDKAINCRNPCEHPNASRW